MNSYFYVMLASFIVIVDRLSKIYILHHPHQSITSWLTFEASINRGISWGMFNSSASTPFIIISVIIAFFILFFCYHTYQRFYYDENITGETMVIAGALSNFFDRVWYHGVIDYILVHYKNHLIWPSFNIADAAIVCGAALILISIIKDK